MVTTSAAMGIGLVALGLALIVIFAGALSAFLTTRTAWLRIQRYLMGTALAVRLATEKPRAVAA